MQPLRRVLLLALSAMLVIWAVVPASSARVASGAPVAAPTSTLVNTPRPASTPQGGTGPTPGPLLSIIQRRSGPAVPGDQYQEFMNSDYPADFQFLYGIGGYNFPPGQTVTISVSNVAVQPVQVVSTSYGSVLAAFSFLWRFCGPSGRQDPAPVFTTCVVPFRTAKLPHCLP